MHARALAAKDVIAAAARAATPRSLRLSADALLRTVFTRGRCRAGRRPAPSVQVLYFPSVYPRELVDAALGRQSGVNVALRVDTDTVDMAAFQAGEHISLPAADGDIGGSAPALPLCRGRNH